jgi:hypothetical protein
VVWLLLGLLFIAPFFDPRRPLRLLHLDLIAIVVLGFILIRLRTVGVPTAQYHVGIVVLAAGLLYLLVRMLVLGFRPREPAGRLIPLVPLTWLLVAVIGLVGFRAAYVKVDHEGVVDVGFFSADGAARIADGKDLYGPWSKPDGHGDTYGPANYLLYLPFERAATWSGSDRSDVLAARTAAFTFDLLTLVGLFLVGRRLRPSDGNALGLALAFAWASCPYTLFVLKFGSNDGLVALLLVAALLALASAPLRGAIAALAAATKFAPAALAPLFATAADERRGRSALVFAASFILVSAAIFLPFVPDGGVRELYDRTVGYQAAREVGSTVWWLFPGLHPLQDVARVAAVGLALAVAVVPRRRGPVQVAALAAAVIIAFELTVSFWWPPYLVWFAPPAFVALFAAYGPGQLFGQTTST